MYALLFFNFLFVNQSGAQSSSTNINQLLKNGNPKITYYSRDVYNAFSQNWAVVQDRIGVMYFGNGNGILTYDGTTWNLITLPNEAAVFALAIDRNNKIYVGAESEIGYLEADKFGRLYYVSLVPQLNGDDKNFSACRNVFCTSKGIYFQSNEELLLWDGEKLKVWKAGENRFFWATEANDNIYISVKNKGLMQPINGEMKLINNGEYFKNLDVFVALPYDKNHVLFATLKNGLFLYDGNNISQFKTENDKYLKDNNIYCGTLLSDSTFAFGTLQAGLVIINKKGKHLLTLNDERVLNSLMVFGLYEDRTNILWAVLNDGIAKIEYPSPFSKFTISPQLKENVWQIKKFNNTIYAGTDKGLYYFTNGTFHSIEGANQRVWYLLQKNNSLFVALDDGLYLLKDRSQTLIQINDLAINSLASSKLDSNRIFIGSALGISSIYYKNGNWFNEENIPGIHGSTYDVIEMPNGNLWLETNVNYIWKVSFQNKEDALHLKRPIIKKYNTANGLPDDLGQLFSFEDNVIFSSIKYSNDIYTYNKSTDKFILTNVFNDLIGLQTKDFHLSSIDNKANIWFHKKADGKTVGNLVAWKLGNGNYKVKDLKEEGIIKNIGGGFLYDAENHFIIYGGKGELIKHDLNVEGKQDSKFNTHISKVIFNNDSLLYGGIRFASNNEITEQILPFYNNKFRFQYSALSYHDEKVNQFQYYLEGFDKHWSNWSGETQSDYTNLSEGNYIFHVRAKNIYGFIGNEDKYAFIILAPWYRSWWSFIFYGLVLLGFVSVIIKWRVNHFRKEKIALENVVKERTSQLSAQAKQLEVQAEKLKEVDKQKARFFANISHEFRTPLTLIKAPVDNALETSDESISKEDKIMIRNNADRLLRLVNQLLDLSKLDANSLELNLIQEDIYKFLRAVGSAFTSYADQRNINYHINIPEQKLNVMFDQDKLEKIIYNLLSNAFKFTGDKGEITINAHFEHHLLTIEIIDNGKGIIPEHLPHIFDRFFQSDNSLTREFEGTGIGLSLTKELVSLMKGDLQVESQPGIRSKFTVIIPIEEISIQKEDNPFNEFKSQSILSNENINSSHDYVEDENTDKSIILIVEDNNDMRGFIKKELFQNYRIFEAGNGVDGFEIAKKEIPDLVITDLMMPKMDGMAFCNQLKNDEYTNHIPVIMLTAKAGQENKLEGLETGADDYLTKPFDKKELQVRINNLILQRQKLRKKFSKEIILQPRNITISSMDEQFLNKVEDLIEKNISNENFSAMEIQNALAISRAQLHRKMKAVTDQAPGEFIRRYRLERAAQMLKNKSGNVTEIAYAVGFGSLSYFTRSFRELFNQSPSEYASQNNPDKE